MASLLHRSAHTSLLLVGLLARCQVKYVGYLSGNHGVQGKLPSVFKHQRIETQVCFAKRGEVAIGNGESPLFARKLVHLGDVPQNLATHRNSQLVEDVNRVDHVPFDRHPGISDISTPEPDLQDSRLLFFRFAA